MNHTIKTLIITFLLAGSLHAMDRLPQNMDTAKENLKKYQALETELQQKLKELAAAQDKRDSANRFNFEPTPGKILINILLWNAKEIVVAYKSFTKEEKAQISPAKLPFLVGIRTTKNMLRKTLSVGFTSVSKIIHH